MNKTDFQSLFNNFKPTSRNFNSDTWDKQLNKWIPYFESISNGLDIDKWIKNDVGYLPDFLDTKEQCFGHARIGNYEQVMIYKYTGSDSRRKNKYRNVYASKKSSDCFENESYVQHDYDTKIKPLLKEIVNADSLQDIYEVEKSDNYKKFVCKQILRKITVLMSVMDNSKYKNEFMWVFNDNSLENLAHIFEVDLDDDATFFENNKKVYDVAKNYADIGPTSTKEDYVKLYDFIWYLSDSNFNAAEFSDFNCCNLIFNGAPGTGKTFGVTCGIEKLQKLDGNKYKDIKYIQFHPSFTYQDFIEGIKPLGVNGGNVDLQVVNGCFKEFCIKVKKSNENFFTLFKTKHANKDPDDSDYPHYYFVVDEINRGNLSKIFGETFTLLENDYRDHNFSGNYNSQNSKKLMTTALSSVISKLNDDDLIYKKVGNDILFGIPFNIHFIGLMNDVDRSIDAFDLALRRRFRWKAMYCNYDVISNELEKDGYSDKDSISDYVDSCEKLNNFIVNKGKETLGLGRSYEIGHAFFLKIRNIAGKKIITDKKKTEVFNTYILGTLKEYIRQVKDENEIDDCVENAMRAFGILKDGKKAKQD